MSQKLYWCLGLPASGKSTKAKEMVDQSQGQLKRVNKDDLRAMIDNYTSSKKFRKSNESFIIQMRDSLIIEALNQGLSVICDDTNFGDKHALRFMQIAREYEDRSKKRCEVVKLDFTGVPLEECIRRDALRGDKAVGKGVIMRMYEQHLHDPSQPLPEYKKSFAKRPVLPKYVPPVEGLPRVVICDLDGTLADISVREELGLMFDASRCDELDTINEPVRMTLMALVANVDIDKIIFMSGRQEKEREPTLRFIQNCFPNWVVWNEGGCSHLYELHMRATGDMRKDAIVKKELFDAHVHGIYNPVLVLDDRNSVVDLWRKEIGIPCFQVNYGDF
jgi:predicted kinase